MLFLVILFLFSAIIQQKNIGVTHCLLLGPKPRLNLLKKMTMRFNGEVFPNFDKTGTKSKILASQKDMLPYS